MATTTTVGISKLRRNDGRRFGLNGMNRIWIERHKLLLSFPLEINLLLGWVGLDCVG